ncbi:hypothetical protein XCR_1657 [Xanthomonas campestris pv. raphani 756C]|nr:hypothetical protein XCR_1657 [Xanthomonas campestris pv. raphani 756C]
MRGATLSTAGSDAWQVDPGVRVKQCALRTWCCSGISFTPRRVAGSYEHASESA